MTAFSYQLYSSRNFPPLSDTLKMLAELGYAQAEGFGGIYGDDAALAELERGLKANGLAMPTGHFSFDMCRDNSARVLGIAKAIGMKGVIVPYIMPDQRPKDAAGWRDYGASLAKVGQPYWDAGLFFGYHNHDFEFVPTATGELPIDLILGADDRLVLEFDVAWAVRAKADPLDTIRKYGSRIRAAHVKDIAPAGENKDEDGWADIGDGIVDWKAIMPALREAGCEYFVVEHDNPKDHHRFASRSIAAARKL
ncbi:sugar phosphate isomerase/epimerase [Ostreiculturibacter nitratireducens]|uniref:sugar phosphate isomerase/epimerase family protein n=1 Tax=Ostreiculturibacter nitratireducens TaxID=3075226 RepID=UPI0031B5C360